MIVTINHQDYDTGDSLIITRFEIGEALKAPRIGNKEIVFIKTDYSGGETHGKSYSGKLEEKMELDPKCNYKFTVYNWWYTN